MAHEIESMFYTGVTPWHGLGTALDNPPTTEIAIREAGLDWSIVKHPIYLGDGTVVPRAMATVRTTDNAIMGVVSDRYTPLQNVEAFKFFDPLVESNLVTLETAGSLKNGQRIWILARIVGDDTRIVGDDMVRKFIMLSNSHDGTTAVRVGFTPVRIVCANTLSMAHGNRDSQLIRLMHSKKVTNNIDAVRDIINIANESFEASAEQFRFLAKKKINKDDLEKYVKIVLDYEHVKDVDLSTRAKNQIAQVINLFDHGRGNDLVDTKPTWWRAYNAYTEFLTHESTKNDDVRYNNLWFSHGVRQNKIAFEKAMLLAQAA
jgi:phage/plasmid-like protein (TIGR03299 family)